MKKFIIIIASVFILILLGDTLYYRYGFYIDLNPDKEISSFVKTDDLVFALEKGFLGGAVLDVLETETLEESSLLWDMENVLITPHIAGPSFEGNVDVQSAIWAICMENLDCYLDGKPLRHVVDRSAGY